MNVVGLAFRRFFIIFTLSTPKHPSTTSRTVFKLKPRRFKYETNRALAFYSGKSLNLDRRFSASFFAKSGSAFSRK
ncbi:MAG: hypothetical protein ACE5I1_29020, partial [bacterium]